MAKRRRLIAPDADALRELETGFAAKPPAGAPPIAQVAGEAAAMSGLTGVTDRVALARDEADAERFRVADEAGLVAQSIAVAAVDPDYILRDRLVENSEDMAELIASLRTGGLRMPIEVVETEDGFGLISGFRRLQAFRQLALQDPVFAQIPAFVRKPGQGAAAYVAMVEENEVRSNLTSYERGRIAVLAAGKGEFPSVEAAVDVLFAAASKAKRSKVRSFALVHESLGDLLRFPSDLTEKAGLKLASALRDGGQSALRAVLARSEAPTAGEEWRNLSEALNGLSEPENGPSRGGRPKSSVPLKPVPLPGGGQLRAELSASGLRIEMRGQALSQEEAEALLKGLRDLLV